MHIVTNQPLWNSFTIIKYVPVYSVKPSKQFSNVTYRVEFNQSALANCIEIIKSYKFIIYKTEFVDHKVIFRDISTYNVWNLIFNDGKILSCIAVKHLLICCKSTHISKMHSLQFCIPHWSSCSFTVDTYLLLQMKNQFLQSSEKYEIIFPLFC